MENMTQHQQNAAEIVLNDDTISRNIKQAVFQAMGGRGDKWTKELSDNELLKNNVVEYLNNVVCNGICCQG
jgi:hypothetical protein